MYLYDKGKMANLVNKLTSPAGVALIQSVVGKVEKMKADLRRGISLVDEQVGRNKEEVAEAYRKVDAFSDQKSSENAVLNGHVHEARQTLRLLGES